MLGAIGALGGMTIAVPASAQCWNEGQVAAARIRDFQMMLMATTLRCRAAGMDISEHYNGFVTARRPQLDLAGAAIRHRFARDGGQAAYDRFATMLANAYGDGSTTPAACDEAAATADDAASSPAALFELAEQRITPPEAEAGLCRRTETLAAAATAPEPTAPAQAPGSTAPAVALASAEAPASPALPKLAVAMAPEPQGPTPAEVAAAIAVLTRYQSVQSQGGPTATP